MAPDPDNTGSLLSDYFSWTSFYSEFADKLLTFRHDRSALLAAIYELPEERVRYLTESFADGSSGRMRDICPFTTMGAFNRRLTDDNRRKVAIQLADLLGMGETDGRRLDFGGIPPLDNRASWLFPRENQRDDDHIDALWRVFADAIEYADGPDETNRASLIDSFNDAVDRKYVKGKLPIGLFWIRPYTFVPLDWYSQYFISEQLELDVAEWSDGETYLDLCDELQRMFNDANLPVHSFPELSARAWDEAEDEAEDGAPEGDESSLVSERSYSVDDIIAEGCFLDRESWMRSWIDGGSRRT